MPLTVKDPIRQYMVFFEVGAPLLSYYPADDGTYDRRKEYLYVTQLIQ